MARKTHDTMSNKSDYQQYLKWAGVPSDTAKHLNPPATFDSFRAPRSLRDILDHGQVIHGVCCIPLERDLNLPDTFECGILSRTYVAPEALERPLPGLIHIRLPYDCDGSTPVLTLIVGVGAGADAVLQGALGLGRDLHYLLPLSLASTHHVEIRQRFQEWTPVITLAPNT